MKNNYTHLSILTLIVSTFFLISSCDKPFEGVNAILTNVKIDHLVSVQIRDANPNATNPYPANPILTLSGDAVENGLIYTTSGQPLDDTPGSATVVNNAISLAVKPFTIISKSQPLRFYIKAEATNYVSNTKQITITSIDSLQYVNLELLKVASLPEGVATNNEQTPTVGGTLAKDFVVNVLTKIEGNQIPVNVATATFPANTVFNDDTNTPITTLGNLNITITHFSATTPESISALPGGTSASIITTTSSIEDASFILAGAVDINVNLGGIPVKSFSTPITIDIKLSSDVYNPITKSTLKVGDQVPLWSKDENSVVWKKEGFASVVKDGDTGNLKTIIQVSHLTTWMTAFDQPMCDTTTSLNYVSNSDTAITAFIKVNVKGGNNQLIQTKTVTIANGDKIELEQLPTDLDYTVSVYAGASATGTPFSTIDLSACTRSGTITNNEISPNPMLSFNLETSCKNGKFRYSGPIDYKVSGTMVWMPFTPSEVGKLTTSLLAWNTTYDFRIIYRDVEYRRSRQVVPSEFRQTGTIWDYYGKTDIKQTFFSSPSNCN